MKRSVLFILSVIVNHLPGKYSIDGLHLSYEGYRVWVEAIKQYVR